MFDNNNLKIKKKETLKIVVSGDKQKKSHKTLKYKDIKTYEVSSLCPLSGTKSDILPLNYVFTNSDNIPKENKSTYQKFEEVLYKETVNISKLKFLSWMGIPSTYRSVCWKLFLNYMSNDKDTKKTEEKKKKYIEILNTYYHIKEISKKHLEHLKIIRLDIPRISKECKIFYNEEIQHMTERILFAWSILNEPGYGQGMDRILIMFIIVFLNDQLKSDILIEDVDMESMSKEILDDVEISSFWCFYEFMKYIKINYTDHGINTFILNIKSHMQLIDKELNDHFEKKYVYYMEISIKWCLCFLLDAFPLRLSIRLFDSYICNYKKLPDFLPCVCAIYLSNMSKVLKSMEKEQIIHQILKLNTQNWKTEEIDFMVVQAIGLKNYTNKTKSILY